MVFDIKNFLENIFAPGKNETLSIMIDTPRDEEQDTSEWKERRLMAEEWLKRISSISGKWGLKVNPLVTYKATLNHNARLPNKCMMGTKETKTKDVIKNSTIILSMPEYSATAPLYEYSKSMKKLRVGSMPGAQKFMEKTGLAADYGEIAEKCNSLISILENAIGAEVLFSTGHQCYFDLTRNKFYGDDGMLHPKTGGTEKSTSNLPAGEVYTVPNEESGSLTKGKLPFPEGNEVGVFVISENKIIEVQGDSPGIEDLRSKMEQDPGWCNVAEFAIGVNNKATVTGNILQDEKAGFHWAFGLSEHLGGITSEDKFNSPENVIHRDFVYAKDNEIECSLLEIIFPDNSRKILIRAGELVDI
ncbi:MAG: aminopeptidase [Candidatus Aminicenantes bacterium]|nr:aminopeptidase [Candidatus Aminicenantes bacterium]